jgi:hypothetical protein
MIELPVWAFVALLALSAVGATTLLALLVFWALGPGDDIEHH